jgi:hypothetical protein
VVQGWSGVPVEQLPRDPWPHERGEDVSHVLDPAGHVPHHADPFAHLLGAPSPFVPHAVHDEASPAATFLIGGEVLAFVVVALLAVSGALSTLTG